MYAEGPDASPSLINVREREDDELDDMLLSPVNRFAIRVTYDIKVHACAQML